MKKVAIVTNNFKGRLDTLELLASLKKLDTKNLDVKIIVVDKTPDEWIGNDIKKSDFPNLDLIQVGFNNGFAAGYNLGMRYGVAWGADYVMIINNDTLIGDKLLLKNLITVLENHPEAAVVSPKILFAPGFEFYKDRYEKSQKGKVIWYAGGEFDWNNVRSIHRGIDEIDTGKYDETISTGFISGCCFMVKSETLEKYGYFDEGLFAYFEDNTWQQKLLLNGKKLFYTGKSYIYHKVSRTAGVGSEVTEYLITRNRLYFTFKYASLRTKFAVLREMLRQLLNGRPAQKRGVLDFLKGIEGPPPYQKIETGIYTYPIRLSIIISNYKTPHLIDQLLKSIYKKDSGFDKNKDEVIVLDDASGDKCKEVVEKYKEVKFLQNSVNKKFVAANNRLLEYTRGELILMLNSDMEVKSGALSTLIETSKKFNNEVVLAGNLIFPDGRDQDSCFFLPTVMGAIKEYFLGKKGSYVMFRPLGNKPVQVECAVMACFLIPRRVLNKIGYLNRNLVMYFEDVDYCRRLKRAGIPLYYVPRAEFAHHHGASSKIIGQNKANDLIIQSSKTYHGRVYYTLLTTTLWAAQKYQKLIHFLRIDKASN